MSSPASSAEPEDEVAALRRRLEREREARRQAEIIAENATRELYGDVQRTLRDLRASREEFASILRSVTDGVVGLDASGIVTYMNEAAARMLRRQSAKAVGEYFHDIAHHANEPLDSCAVFATLASGKGRASPEVLRCGSDGSLLKVESTYAPIVRDGATAGVVVVFREVPPR